MAGGTAVAPTPTQAPQKGRQLRWGDRGVSERMIVQDAQDNVTPRNTRIRLEETGILEELQHHVYGAVTATPGTGTVVKDPNGPMSIIQQYALTAGANTPLISLTNIGLALLQQVEWSDRSFQANATPADVQLPEPDLTSVFNHPTASATLRFWAKIPVALKWLGMPGGSVGYLILQNKRISNVFTAQYGVSGAAAPYTLSGSALAAPYQVTGPATITGSPVIETWKTLHTVPNARSKMPVFGFTRYISEVVVPYSGTTFKYLFEPGGLLLRAFPVFLDGGATPVTDAQLSQVIFSYGTNRQVEIWTTYRNRLQQLQDYGRQLPQGAFAFDWYTQRRTAVSAKSTENTANIQLQATMASVYTPAANSVVHILLDKVYVVQNRLS